MKRGNITRRKKIRVRKIILIAALFYVAFIICKWSVGFLFTDKKISELEKVSAPEWVDVQLLDIGGVARRGEKLDDVKDIVIHYVGNPGTTAQQNRDFYNSPQSEVSSHFVIGLEGEIIQAIPLSEKSSATNWRNNDTISIEVCHPDETGQFTQASYNSLVKLTAWLREQCNLDVNHIIRHYDVTGKLCPLYFVEHEDKWEQFKEDVRGNSQS
ncbi:peptidoglycan recognition protein family protein [Bacillus massiliigorillae]|uniref:peptidoglycan recognition protein family protein n=1 Tax=Bacillus massiliigorillae TaxID=1243664 RepID=UPI0003A14EAC|nr:peptidoglycan recognition family protein [Bacillus massiliigorillae]